MSHERVAAIAATMRDLGHRPVRKRYPRRQKFTERIELAISPELKERLYEVAAANGKTAAEYMRTALAKAIAENT